jgi:hypothetical protein
MTYDVTIERWVLQSATVRTVDVPDKGTALSAALQRALGEAGITWTTTGVTSGHSAGPARVVGNG